MIIVLAERLALVEDEVAEVEEPAGDVGVAGVLAARQDLGGGREAPRVVCHVELTPEADAEALAHLAERLAVAEADPGDLKVGRRAKLEEAEIFAAGASDEVERVDELVAAALSEQPLVVMQVEGADELRGRPLARGDDEGELETPMDLKQPPAILEGVAAPYGRAGTEALDLPVVVAQGPQTLAARLLVFHLLAQRLLEDDDALVAVVTGCHRMSPDRISMRDMANTRMNTGLSPLPSTKSERKRMTRICSAHVVHPGDRPFARIDAPR